MSKTLLLNYREVFDTSIRYIISSLFNYYSNKNIKRFIKNKKISIDIYCYILDDFNIYIT